jgi:hypothetical protein
MKTENIDAELWGLNDRLPPETGLLVIDRPTDSTRSYRFADGTVVDRPGAALEHLTDLVREHEVR